MHFICQKTSTKNKKGPKRGWSERRPSDTQSASRGTRLTNHCNDALLPVDLPGTIPIEVVRRRRQFWSEADDRQDIMYQILYRELAPRGGTDDTRVSGHTFALEILLDS